MARSSAAAAPLYVTQINIEAVFGFTPRQFLDVVRRDGIAHKKDGQKVIVSVDVFSQWVAAHPDERTGKLAPAVDLTEEQEVEEIERRLALRKTG